MSHTNFVNFQQKWSRFSLILLFGVLICPLLAAATVPDPVLEWDAIMGTLEVTEKYTIDRAFECAHGSSRLEVCRLTAVS